MFSAQWGRTGFATAMALTLASSSAVAQTATPTRSATYNAVLDGMSCKQRPSGRMDCEYRVGHSMRFAVMGVGQEDAVVTVVQADSAGEYSASIVPLHGCVVVKPIRSADAGTAPVAVDSVASFAYVSPRTGKVYHTWATCLSATRTETRGDTKTDAKSDAARPATKVADPAAKAPPTVKPPA